jgi:hypothetical protein
MKRKKKPKADSVGDNLRGRTLMGALATKRPSEPVLKTGSATIPTPLGKTSDSPGTPISRPHSRVLRQSPRPSLKKRDLTGTSNSLQLEGGDKLPASRPRQSSRLGVCVVLATMTQI